MKRLAIMAVCSAIAGWLLGDMMRANGAEHQYAEEILAAKDAPVVAKPKPRHLGKNTVVLAPRDEDDDQITNDENLPEDIRRARQLGAKARARAMAEIIYNVKHGLVSKDGGWGMGGPYFPLGADLLRLRPRERPVLMAAVPGSFGSYYLPGTPFSVADPINEPFLLGPGDPTVNPHVRLIEDFLPPVVPEPATWSLLILGFGALGWRMSLVRRRVA